MPGWQACTRPSTRTHAGCKRLGPTLLASYSGHGAADGGTNYLIPVDVKTTETGELWDQSLRLTEITRKLKTEASNATHFVVFDACRNTLKLTRQGSRALVQSKGFVPVGQESGMLIAYATAEGELASDVGVGAGPYGSVLAEEIVKPGVEAVVMFRVVQRRVRMAIKQEPLGFNAMGDVYLAGAEAPKLPTGVTEAAREWERVDKASSVELETFVRRHGSSPEADYARARIEDLKKQVVSSIPKTKQPAPMGGMLRCESLLERAACEFDPSCSWADDKKQCQRKSGSLAAAMLKAKPPPKAASQTPCAGVETQVGNETRCLKPGDSFRDCPDCPEMVVVPAGSFMMGSPPSEEGRTGGEGPQRRVTIARPFAVGKYEVMFADWDACSAAGACRHNPKDQGWGRGNRPVINVSWNNITEEYLLWLARKIRKTYRLLTEAEWEYAARAGGGGRYTWGDDIGRNRANCDGCGSQWDNNQTAPVGSFQANAFGLHDMHGNVWEWVEDCWHENYQGAPTDGSAWTTACSDGSRRVVRGGSWGISPQYLRSADRSGYLAVGRGFNLGFRLARTLILDLHWGPVGEALESTRGRLGLLPRGNLHPRPGAT